MADYQPQSTTTAIISRLLSEASGTAITKRAGYTYINGSMIPNAISPILARAMRAGRIVRPGVGMTEKFTASIDPKSVNNVTVQLQTNMGVRVRTLKEGFSAGTTGNDGLINLNPKIIPSTVPFDIPLRQQEDQPLFFPQMQLETMLFDETTETIANYIENVDNGIDSYHIAKALSYALYRGAREADDPTDITDYTNIIPIASANAYDDTYMIQKVNTLNAALANGDSNTQLMTFTGPREMVCRPELIGYLKTPKTGYIINSDISTRLLYEPNFDIREAERYGTQSRGEIVGYNLQEAPQGIWSLVEKWLNLSSGDLDGVLGIVFTPQAYASGGVGKREMRMLQSSQYDGVVAFPYIKYGGTAYRLMYVIAKSDWSIPTALQSITAPAPVTAPAQWYSDNFEPIEKVIYDASGNPVGLETIANVVKGNDLPCQVTINVANSSSTALTDALVTATVNSNNIAVTNNGDGSYTLFCKQGATPVITIAKTDYTSQTITLTAANTAYSTYERDVTLVAIVTYTVTYDANTGTGTMTDAESPYDTGSLVTVLANGFTAPTDKEFSKYNTASDGTGTDYLPGATFTIAANTTLYAIWVSST